MVIKVYRVSDAVGLLLKAVYLLTKLKQMCQSSKHKI